MDNLPLNVGQLIEKLKQLDPKMPVGTISSGYWRPICNNAIEIVPVSAIGSVRDTVTIK